MKHLVTGALALAISSLALAGAIDFDLKDPKGVNNIVFKLDAPLESINGITSGISGSVRFDPEQPGNTTGKIVVQSESLSVGNAKMLEHLQGGGWLGVKEHPEITFELASLSDVASEGPKTTAIATGTMTIKGVSKEISAPISLTFLADMLAKRGGGKEGDLLVLRSDFVINRSDFGIKPGEMAEKVSEEISLTLSLAGSAPR